MRRPLPETPRGARGPGTRVLLAFGLVLAGLLALVAVASRSAVDGGAGAGGRGSPALPTWFSSYVFTFVIVVGFFLLLLGFVLSRREEMNAGRPTRRSAPAAIALLLSCVVILVVAVRSPQKISQLIERIRPGGFDRDALPGDAAAANITPEFEWIAVAVASSLSIAVVAAVLAYPVLRRHARRRADDTLAEALSSALDDTLDDVRAEPDPRRAIILAYARMEAVLDAHGLPRHEAEAPLEYLARVLLELDVGAPPVEALTELFERAKFSHHALAAPDKDRAIDALETIRGELRAR